MTDWRPWSASLVWRGIVVGDGLERGVATCHGLGIAITTDAALYRIQKLTPAGKLLAFWGTENAEPGGFGPPLNGKSGPGGPVALCVNRQD